MHSTHKLIDISDVSLSADVICQRCQLSDSADQRDRLDEPCPLYISSIWCCSCGEQTPCDQDDLKLGSVWHCHGCDTDFGCVQSKARGKVWVEIKPESAAFHDLFGSSE